MGDATYKILGRHEKGEWEEIDSSDSGHKIIYMLGEYRLAFGPGWEMKIVKPQEAPQWAT